MDFSVRGSHTSAAWAAWRRRNVDVLEDGDPDRDTEGVGVRIAAAKTRGYRDKQRVLDDVAVRSPRTSSNSDPAAEVTRATALEWVDLDIEPCGNRYFLTKAGEVYRHVPGENHLTPLGVAATDSDPTAIAMTTDTLYVATVDPGAIYAYSRELGQLRWVLEDGIDDPVAFVRDGARVYLLDAGAHPGRGSVARLCNGPRVQPIVTALHDPIDADFDDEGSLYVLESQLRTDSGDGNRHLVRRLDRRALDRPPVPATETIWIPPQAVRSIDTDDPFVPNCLTVGAPGEVLIGVDPEWSGDRRLLSYRSERAGFDGQARFRAGCRRLVSVGRDDDRQVFVIDGERRVFRVDASTAYRTDPVTGEVRGVLRRSFDAGVEDAQWHRLTLDPRSDTDTRVVVHYRATNAKPASTGHSTEDHVGLQEVRGIGPRKSRRLRTVGINDLADFVDRDADTVAKLLSVEEISVGREQITEWRQRATSLLDDETLAHDDLETVSGIGPTRASRLRAGGVTSLSEFAALDTGLVTTLLSRGIRTVSPDRVREWMDEARALLNSDQSDPMFGLGEGWTTVEASPPRDVLLDDATGRYLRVQLELIGTDADSPVVRTLDASYPRQSYLEELPAVYREDERTSAFLESYLALFERIFTDVEAGLDGLTRYLDPQGIPAEAGHIEWLGNFLATDIDERWSTDAKRAFIERAPELYRMRGTRRGLQEMIGLYLDAVDVQRRDWDRAVSREREHLDRLVEHGQLTEAERTDALERHAELADGSQEPLVRVIEHQELECIDEPENHELFSRLISCPTGFLVLCHPALSDEQFQAIGRIVRHQRPAHTSGRAVALRHRTVLPGDDGNRGFHTYLGINTVLPSRELTLDDATLGQTTTLGSREPNASLGVRTRLDQDSRLS